MAVVGAGPAGLTCAYFLAKMGYPVTVFEAQPVAGGMLGIAVPEFRLPREVIQAEIDYIASCGVEIVYDSPIDARHTVNDLLREGFAAVFIAAGAQASRRIGIAGEEEDLKGLYYGLSLLSEVRAGARTRLQGRVIVIGGGNVAIDAARTALRLGAAEVQIYYRRTRAEMPAWSKDIEEALEEGVILNTLWAPNQILQENGKVTGVRFVHSRTVVDETGKARLALDEATTQAVETDNVIIAVGQAPDISFLSKDGQLERALWGSLAVQENTLSTNIPGIFAGGDFTTGPSTVIQAIAGGRRAAIAIDHYLKGRKGPIRIVDEKTATPEEAKLALDDETSEERPRIEVGVEKPEERIGDFREVERGFSEDQARREAHRCLRCDLERERREA